MNILIKVIIGIGVGLGIGQLIGMGVVYLIDDYSFGRYVVEQQVRKDDALCHSGKCLFTTVWKGHKIIHNEYDDSTDTMYRTAIMRRNQADSIVKALKMIQ